jgi:hypothetical protein
VTAAPTAAAGLRGFIGCGEKNLEANFAEKGSYISLRESAAE